MTSEALPCQLAAFSTHQLKRFLGQASKPVLIWPVGSTEPHGPHLPLATDSILSTENAKRAVKALRAEGIEAVEAPLLPYGVTDFAEGFAGAISIPEETLVTFLVAAVSAHLDQGFKHVCLVNHHLESGQLAALEKCRSHIANSYGEWRVSVPQVISKRWGRQLGDEFRSGACHAGAYECSMVLACRPEWVNRAEAKALPALDISLSKAMAAGLNRFRDVGMADAYTGAPADATPEEGERLFGVLTNMVTTVVTEHLEKAP